MVQKGMPSPTFTTGGKPWTAVLAVAVATSVCLVVFGLAAFLMERFIHRKEYSGRPLGAWLREVNSNEGGSKDKARKVIGEAGEDRSEERRVGKECRSRWW